MIPSTLDTPTVITRRPAWEAGVEFEQAMDTDVFRSRAGLEQRQQRRQRGRYLLDYTTRLSAAEALTRDVLAASENVGPLIVPFWTRAARTDSPIIANVVTIDYAPDGDFFSDGDYVFFDSPSQGEQFRLIAGTAGSSLTLVADGGAIAFVTGTRVYPCRRCIYEAGRAEWAPESREATSEKLRFITL
jgi:hypothetical protein